MVNTNWLDRTYRMQKRIERLRRKRDRLRRAIARLTIVALEEAHNRKQVDNIDWHRLQGFVT